MISLVASSVSPVLSLLCVWKVLIIPFNQKTFSSTCPMISHSLSRLTPSHPVSLCPSLSHSASLYLSQSDGDLSHLNPSQPLQLCLCQLSHTDSCQYLECLYLSPLCLYLNPAPSLLLCLI